MFKRLRIWFAALVPRRPKSQLSVSFDSTEIRVLASAEMDSRWNQAFLWSNIRRVCFKDGGILSSDIIYISLIDPDTVMVIPTEAVGGAEFFGALCEKGLFPEKIWRKAVGDTSGGLHCWPPGDKDS